MDKYFVTHSQAVALKELGFDMPCLAYYEGTDLTHGMLNDIGKHRYLIAPLKSQVFEWFREKHGLFSEIQPYLIIGTQWRYTITNRNNSSGLPHKEQFKTYEEAESACIDKLIELCHDK